MDACAPPTGGDSLAAGGVETILAATEAWLRRRHFAGADPFDALAGRRVPLVVRRHAKLRQATIQAAKRSPADLRPLLGVPPLRLAKALGLVASGYASLSEAGWYGSAERSGLGLLEWLRRSRHGGRDSGSWGYEFDVQTRWAFYPAGTPNIIVTTFVASAFLDWYERTGEEDHLATACAATEFLVERLLVRGSGAQHFGYVPGVSTLIHNANLLGCGLLARTGSLAGRGEWLELARRAADATLAAQEAEDLWPYGEGRGLAWVDGFHTAYVLGGLHDLWQATDDARVLDALRRGLRAYLTRLFTVAGVPKYTTASLYPIDIHCASTAIDLLVRLREIDERCLPAARRVLAWTIANMWDARGFFYYQRTRWYANRIPYVRWSQAHMFRALARLLAASPR